MKHAKEKNNGGESFGWRDTLVWCGIPIIVVLLVRPTGILGKKLNEKV